MTQATDTLVERLLQPWPPYEQSTREYRLAVIAIQADRKAAADALAALQAERDAGWQPIETAPDNAQVLIAAYRDDGSLYADIAQAWAHHREYPKRVEFFIGRQRVHPTHWRPLPTPPQVQP